MAALGWALPWSFWWRGAPQPPGARAAATAGGGWTVAEAEFGRAQQPAPALTTAGAHDAPAGMLEVCGWGLLPQGAGNGFLPDTLRELDARVQQRFVEQALASPQPRLRLLGHWWAGTQPAEGERAQLLEAAASDPLAALLAAQVCRQVQGDVDACNLFGDRLAERRAQSDNLRDWLALAHRADGVREAQPWLERAAQARDYDSGTRDIVRTYRQLAEAVTTDTLARGLLDHKLAVLLSSLPVPGFALLLDACQILPGEPAPAYCGAIGERLAERGDDPVAVALGAAVLRRIEHPAAARAAARAGDLVEAQRLLSERQAPAGQYLACGALAARGEQQAMLAAYGEVGAALALVEADRRAQAAAARTAAAGGSVGAEAVLASPFGGTLAAKPARGRSTPQS